MKEALKHQIMQLNTDVTRIQNKTCDVIEAPRLTTIFPRVPNLPFAERKYLDGDLKYLSAVLTPKICRPAYPYKKNLDRSIQKMKRVRAFKIIEVEIPKPENSPLDTWPLPGPISPSDIEFSDSEPEPRYLVSELPEVGPSPNEPVDRPLFGSTEQGWQVLRAPVLHHQIKKKVCKVINLDGNVDLSDNEDSLDASLEEINSSQESEARTRLEDCPEVVGSSTALSPIQTRPFLGFVDCLQPRTNISHFPSTTSTPGRRSGPVPFSEVSFLSDTDEPMVS